MNELTAFDTEAVKLELGTYAVSKLIAGLCTWLGNVYRDSEDVLVTLPGLVVFEL